MAKAKHYLLMIKGLQDLKHVVRPIYIRRRRAGYLAVNAAHAYGFVRLLVSMHTWAGCVLMRRTRRV
jgi:hypothetical protein